MSAPYAEKLKDPRWQRRRLEVFQAAGWACASCGDSSSTLHVHHLIYRGDPWDAPEQYLECLCEDCHGWRESYNKVYGTSLTRTGVIRFGHSPWDDIPERPVLVRTATPGVPRAPDKPGVPWASERLLLRVMLDDRTWIARATEEISAADFRDPLNRQVYERLLSGSRTAPPQLVGERIEEIKEDDPRIANTRAACFADAIVGMRILTLWAERITVVQKLDTGTLADCDVLLAEKQRIRCEINKLRGGRKPLLARWSA